MKETVKTYAGLNGLGAFPEGLIGDLSRSLVFALLTTCHFYQRVTEENRVGGRQ